MFPNSLPTERMALLAVIDPDAYSNGAQTSGYFALKDFTRFAALILAGDIVSTGTVDAKLTVYTDGSGGGALDVPGATMTQMTQAGTDSNKQAWINFNPDLVAGNTAYTHGRLTVTLGTAGADMAAMVFGFDPRYAPATDSDATTVDSVTSV
jgi:hypothetical protein